MDLQLTDKVVGASRSIDTLERISTDKLVAVSADLSKQVGAKSLIQTAIDEFDRIDILINNVRIAPIRNGFLSIEDEEWEVVLNTNFMSMVRVTRAALPYMIQQQKGSIVSISSEVGQLPDAMLPDYSVSKAAMLSLSKSIAQEFGPKGIRSNVVSPGPTRTPLWDRPGGFADGLAATFGMEKKAAIEHFAKNVRALPLGRLGTAEETAAIIAFVASDQASFVTGSEYMVNGGSLRQL
ncbi:SDR family oxidoreductase [Shimazuella sp. AN120528]|uniref:SDR family NAD(P)-dependent oxidoreductase n=1 Tax=Shimazuella soli TaxID=1892854 RepID=UPI001F0F1EA9|nr:SDR family oxidoreductase [Shimazuella soli]MCH5584753.1 SDR family oxidoreductase [Shimazuella soli]